MSTPPAPPTPRHARFQRGLVVGKFSPLHRGHELVITQAQAQCDEVMVLGYSMPEFAGCERVRREAWVRARFPLVRNVQIDAARVAQACAQQGMAVQAMPHNLEPDAVQQQWLIWLLDQVLGWRPDAMFGSETYLGPTTQRMQAAWGQAVTPVTVDLRRAQVPVSATRIRADVHAQRSWLAPEVYQHFVPRVVLLGGESTGKTTLAQALAAHWQTCWVPEYGRERWEARGGVLTLDDLIAIGHTQIAREDALHAQAVGALFCDTSPLTTLGYAGWMFDASPASLQAQAQRPYDLTVLCEDDIPFEQDGTRQAADFRQRQQRWYEAHVAELARRGRPWVRASGPLEERVQQVNAALAPWVRARP